mgnify:CR=1 FL=1
MKTQISVGLTEEQIKQVDRYARGQAMSRSQLIRKIILNSLSSLQAGYSPDGSFGAHSDLLTSIDYEIIKAKSELKKLQYQKQLLEDQSYE